MASARCISYGGPDRPQRVVLVQPWQAEDRHDRVTDELLDRAAVAHEDGLHLVEVAGHDLAQCLGVERLAEVGRALEVAEEDRHRLPHLVRPTYGGQRRAAEAAQPELGRVLFAAARADLHVPESTHARRADAYLGMMPGRQLPLSTV